MQEDSKYYIFNINIDETKRYSIIQFSRNLEKLNHRELSHIESLGFFSYYGQIEDDFLNTYLFTLSDGSDDRLRTLRKFYSQYYPQEIGTETGKKLQSLSNSIKNKIEKQILEESQKTGLFKVTKGDYENLVVELKQFGKEKSKCVAYIFGKDYPLEIESKYLESTDIDLEVFRFGENYIRTDFLENSKREILLDCNYLLFASIAIHNSLFSKDRNSYVGGSYGFYFNLLKIKMLFPEYHIIPVYGNLEEDIQIHHRHNVDFSQYLLDDSKLEKIISILKEDQIWSKAICSNLGYSIIDNSKHATRELISSTINSKVPTIIYSRDHAYEYILSKDLDLFKFKFGDDQFDQHLEYSEILLANKISQISELTTIRSLEGSGFSNLHRLDQGHLNTIYELVKRYGLKKGLERCEFNSVISRFLKTKYLSNLSFLTINSQSVIPLKRESNKKNKNAIKKLLEKNSFHREASIIDNVFPILTSNV